MKMVTLSELPTFLKIGNLFISLGVVIKGLRGFGEFSPSVQSGITIVEALMQM